MENKGNKGVKGHPVIKCSKNKNYEK